MDTSGRDEDPWTGGGERESMRVQRVRRRTQTSMGTFGLGWEGGGSMRGERVRRRTPLDWDGGGGGGGDHEGIEGKVG